jgi:rhombotail lipoprotein
MKQDGRQQQAASLIEFLYPGKAAPPSVSVMNVAEIKPPLRIGLAFVPDNADVRFRITETERVALLEHVREAFERYPFVGRIEVVPSAYLAYGGGFENVERIANLLSLDCVALLSYDQMQFADASNWSLLYWTGIGLYVVPADRFDVLTSLEAAVFDVRSRRLLLRAGGASQVKGSATWAAFSEEARAARGEGFREALARLIPGLHGEVKRFRERAPGDQTIRLDLPPGYDPQAVGPAAARRQ